LAIAVFASPVQAQQTGLPAVSQRNLTIDGGGGELDKQTLAYLQGSWSLPLSHSFGFQIDAAGGDWDSKAYGAVAGHLFWRNPSVGLIGLYGDYTNSGAPRAFTTNTNIFGPTLPSTIAYGSYFSRAALETEAYFGKLSLEARAGWEGGTAGNHLYDRANIAFYPVDNLRLAIGHLMTGDVGAGTAQIEFQPTTSGFHGLSFYIQGLNSHDVTSVFGGVKFYFGAGDKTLIRRHREDDPSADTPNDLFGVANGVQYNEVCHFEGSVIPCGPVG
jgi:hypothetical protein